MINMLNPRPTIVHLKDYTPPPFLITSVDLEIDIGDELTRVTAMLALHRNPRSADGAAPLVLDADELELESVALNGTPLSASAYAVGANRLTVFSLPAQFALTTVCRIYP